MGSSDSLFLSSWEQNWLTMNQQLKLNPILSNLWIADTSLIMMDGEILKEVYCEEQLLFLFNLTHLYLTFNIYVLSCKKKSYEIIFF